MVESEAKELSEEIMLGAVVFGHEQMQPVIDAIIDLAEACAKEPWDLTQPAPEVETVRSKFEAEFGDRLAEAYTEVDKMIRRDKVAAVKEEAIASLDEEDEASLAWPAASSRRWKAISSGAAS